MRKSLKGYAKALSGAVVVGVALLAASSAQAGPYSSLVVFGDSLSDTGNVYAATGGGTPSSPPYFNGRFTNGLNWIDGLAASLGVPGGAVPALLGGNNYAFGGARTGADPTQQVPGVLAQVGGLWSPAHATADPNALYVLVGGGNDMRDARRDYTTNSPGDQAQRQAAAASAAGNLSTAVGALVAKGARHILLGNLPNLGFTPEAVGLGLVDASADASARFNALLPGIESFYETLVPGLDIDFVDLAGLLGNVRNDALNNGGATYGITNVLAPCNGFAGSPNLPATSCDISLFSDALHPSAAGHSLMAQAALRALGIPEPAPLALLGAAALLFALRRHAAGQRVKRAA